MKKTWKIIAILASASLLSPVALADHEDPIGQLLNAQAIFTPPNSGVDAQGTHVAANTYSGLDELDIFLKSEVKSSINVADPLGSLIAGEGVFDTKGVRQSVVSAAFNYLNTPYKYGGNNALTGFDCSGLVRAIYLQVANTSLPRTSAAQAGATTTIKRTELEPGDLVFFRTVKRRQFSHVGIYVGNNKFIHAPRTGAQVRIEDINQGYWNSRFTGARRVAVK